MISAEGLFPQRLKPREMSISCGTTEQVAEKLGS
jgi:hypothetical protein